MSVFLRYIQCIHQKLYHLTAADYEDFSSIILAARAAFQITPEGNAQFKDWLQSIRRYFLLTFRIRIVFSPFVFFLDQNLVKKNFGHK